MSILQEDSGLGVEIKFEKWEHVYYLTYAFRFFYGSYPLFNPEIVDTDYVRCEEYNDDTLVPTIERALKTNNHQRWTPLENEFEMVIYAWPEMGLRGALSRKDLWVSEKEKLRLKIIDDRRDQSHGLLPEDVFEFGFFFNSANLINIHSDKDERSQWDIGPGLKISFTREELSNFLTELKSEYKSFKKTQPSKKDTKSFTFDPDELLKDKKKMKEYKDFCRDGVEDSNKK